jgi:hypothetical protein
LLIEKQCLRLLKILREGQKGTSEDFKDEIHLAIDRGSFGSRRLERLTDLTLHFDDTLVHNAKEVSERLSKYGFSLGILRTHRTYHRATSFYFVTCDRN